MKNHIRLALSLAVLATASLVTGCSTAQITTFKADANKAAEDVLTAAPKVVAYTATTAADIGIVALDLTKGAAAVVTLTQPATATTSSVSK